MKKFFKITAAAVSIFLLTACGKTEKKEDVYKRQVLKDVTLLISGGVKGLISK